MVEDGIADFDVEYFHQKRSDFATLGDLALENLGADVSVQIIQNKIVVSKRGIKTKIKSKTSLEPVKIHKEQVIRYRTTVAERGKYNRVKARWHDPEKAEDFFEMAGEGEPALTIQRTFSDPLEAQRAAESQLRALNQGRATLHASLIGTPTLLPQLPLELTGLPPGAEGEWVVCSVTHKIDSNGFSTELTAKSQQQIQKELQEQNVEMEE